MGSRPDGAEDGIRTRDPHLGKVFEFVYGVQASPLSWRPVHGTSTKSAPTQPRCRAIYDPISRRADPFTIKAQEYLLSPLGVPQSRHPALWRTFEVSVLWHLHPIAFAIVVSDQFAPSRFPWRFGGDDRLQSSQSLLKLGR